MQDKSKRHIDFIGIGAQKAGTTWLFSVLLEHPEICGPRDKELGYFHYAKINPITHTPHITLCPHESSTFEDFCSFFDACPEDAVVGEFTPLYLASKESPSLIHTHLPHAKLVAVLRNPISRAYSHYVHEKHRQGFSFSFEEAIERSPEFLDYGLYGKHLSRWREMFPPEQFHIVLYDDIVSDPSSVISSVYRFLGVDSTYTPALTETYINEGKDKKSHLEMIIRNTLFPLIRNTRLGTWMRHTTKVRLLGETILRRISVLRVQKNTTLSPETVQYLKKYYQSDVEILSKILKRDMVTLWGFDNLAK